MRDRLFSVNKRLSAVMMFFLLSFPLYSYANAGLPIIFITFPYMLLAFIPIFLIEGVVYKKRLNMSYGSSFSVSFLANLLSTLIGFPLAWLLSLVVEILLSLSQQGATGTVSKVLLTVLGPAWLAPPIETADQWYVPIAAFFGLIPAYFVSVWMELFVARRCFDKVDIKEVKKAVRAANLLTYGILGAVCLILALVTKLFS
ncbi:MAG: hypothetical protein WC418_03155 [Candidatus Omnitrophota bacterium]|jgi:hypothetical protein